MKAKTLAILLALAMVLSAFAACGSGAGTSAASAGEPAQSAAEPAAEEAAAPEEAAPAEAPEQAETESASEEAAPEAEAPAEAGVPGLFDYELPITENSPEYSFLVGFNPGVSSFINGFEDNQVMSEWMDRTGIRMTFSSVHPSTAAENFNLALAAGDLPDVADNGLDYYNGSTTSAIADDIFVDLMEFTEECPNYMAAISSNELIKKALTTDEGYVAAFYMMRTNNSAGEGMMIRQDWLDDLGLDMPETYDQVHDVLEAFKTEKGATSPMLLNNSGTWSMGAFSWGYDINGYMTTDPNVSLPLYVVDGDVKFAMLEDDYVDYLSMISGWYSEGLIAPDIENITMFQTCGSYVLNNETGYFYSASSLLSVLEGMATTEGFTLVGAPQPVRNAGDALHFTPAYSFAYDGGQALAAVNNWTVSADAEDVPTLIQCLDYFFSPAGSLLANYGVEGVSFEYDADGVPHFTELITNNDQGMTMDNAVYIYTLQYGAFMEDYNRYVDTYTDKELQCAEAWNWEVEDNYSYPVDFVSLTTAESDTYGAVFSDISTVLEENILQFITGSRSMDDYPAFQQQLIDMGLQDIVDIYQDAYDRFLER